MYNFKVAINLSRVNPNVKAKILSVEANNSIELFDNLASEYGIRFNEIKWLNSPERIKQMSDKGKNV